MNFDINPFDKPVDYNIIITMNPLEIIYNKTFIDSISFYYIIYMINYSFLIVSFFKKDTLIDIQNQLFMLKQQTTNQIMSFISNKESINLSVDIKVQYIIVLCN